MAYVWLICFHLEALIIHLPIQVMNGAISKTTRAKISSQYYEGNVNLECLNLEFSSQYINFNIT
jgi:hypothetical protein